MGAMASQITSLTIVYSTVYSGADVWGIHRGPMNSPHNWPVTRKGFHFMTSAWWDITGYVCTSFLWGGCANTHRSNTEKTLNSIVLITTNTHLLCIALVPVKLSWRLWEYLVNDTAPNTTRKPWANIQLCNAARPSGVSCSQEISMIRFPNFKPPL